MVLFTPFPIWCEIPARVEAVNLSGSVSFDLTEENRSCEEGHGTFLPQNTLEHDGTSKGVINSNLLPREEARARDKQAALVPIVVIYKDLGYRHINCNGPIDPLILNRAQESAAILKDLDPMLLELEVNCSQSTSEGSSIPSFKVIENFPLTGWPSQLPGEWRRTERRSDYAGTEQYRRNSHPTKRTTII